MTELEEIRERYERGELDPIKRDLVNFVRAKGAAIRKFKSDFNAKNPRTPLTDETAIKFYILKARSINPAGEIQEQLQEIEKEKWIRGEKTGHAPDPYEVATDWARKYSPGWRSHRVTTIIYVFERDKDAYIRLLNGK